MEYIKDILYKIITGSILSSLILIFIKNLLEKRNIKKSILDANRKTNIDCCNLHNNITLQTSQKHFSFAKSDYFLTDHFVHIKDSHKVNKKLSILINNLSNAVKRFNNLSTSFETESNFLYSSRLKREIFSMHDRTIEINNILSEESFPYTFLGIILIFLGIISLIPFI